AKRIGVNGVWEAELNTVVEQCNMLIASETESFGSDFTTYMKDMVKATETLFELLEQMPSTSVELKQYLSASAESADLVHDLRTPINIIRIISRYIATNLPINLNEAQFEYLQKVYDVAMQMYAWVDEELDLGKIKVGMSRSAFLVLELFDITELLDEFKET